jgi:guanylate kinase
MLFVITGPSGVGKSYLIEQLLKHYPQQFISPQLITTRPARASSGEVDRQSVSEDQFQAMQAAGDFVIADKFHGNWYGFPVAITEQRQGNTIVNIWPALISKFAELPDVRLIGLYVRDDKLDLLRNRMLQRGDSPAVVTQRMEQVTIDSADLKSNAVQVAHSGKMFEITDDDTIPQQVIPWILGQL